MNAQKIHLRYAYYFMEGDTRMDLTKPQFNTYIGARYVPIVDGEWSSTKAYEPLVIVTYQGNSYTSKTYVAAGIPPTNTQFWAETGNYNAQVEAYRQEVQALKEAVAYSFVYVDDFGAVGDGITDDSQAFANAIAACNANGSVLKTKGKTYAVGNAAIVTKCSIDFNDATIILTGNAASDSFLEIVDPAKVDYTLTQSILTKDGVLDSRLYGKSFSIISPLSMGVRDGATYYYEGLYATDENGRFINKKYMPEIITGTYRFIETKNLESTTLFFENVKIRFNSTTTNLETFAHVIRNNVIFRNVVVEGAVDNTVNNRGTFYCHSCFNLIFENFMGYNPYSKTVSGYVVDLYDCDSVQFNEFNVYSKSGGSWPALAAQYCTNVTYEHCHTDRIDSHSSGTYTARNCTIQYANYSHSYGNIIFEDCVFTGPENNHCVYFRGDFGLFPSGSLVFNNCEFFPRATNLDAVRVDMSITEPSTWINFNQEGTKVFMNGCVVHGGTNTVRCVGINTSNRTMVEIYVRNTKSNSVNLVSTPRDEAVSTDVRFKKVCIENCDFAGTYIMNGSYMDLVEILDCDMGKTVMNINCKSAWFTIRRCVMGGLNCPNNWFNNISDNWITIDVAPTLGTPTQQIVDNNILVSSTTTNQAAWNGIKPA